MTTLVHPDLPGQSCERASDEEVNALTRSGWHVASDEELAALQPADDTPPPNAAPTAEQPARRTSKKEQ